MAHINIQDYENAEYFSSSSCNEDHSKYYDLAQTISQSLGGRVLDVGCGLGWLVKHLQNRKLDAWGIDISHYAIESSASPDRCLLGDSRKLHETFPATFDVVVLQDFVQTQELDDLTKSLSEISRVCKGKIFLIDSVLPDRNHFALERSPEWYLALFKDFGWRPSLLQNFIRKTSGLNNLFVFERIRVPFVEPEPDPFVDPWLVHRDNAVIATCTLTTTEADSALFKDRHHNLWWNMHFVEEGGDRVTRERKGITGSSSDYVFVSDDTACASRDWLLAALGHFRNPDVGAVVSPVSWVNGQEEAPEGDYWCRFPIMFRTLAYQQSQGTYSKFKELGWRVARLKCPLSSAPPAELRVFDETPSVTIITPFDDSKVKLLDRYLETLFSVDYERRKLHLKFWCDGREAAPGSVLFGELLRNNILQWGSVSLHQASTDDYWLQMADENHYKWPGVKYPISCRVAGLYNRATAGITTDRVLLWESDTIPVEGDFLKVLSENLEPEDGGISGHYVCRKEEKSLAWSISSIVPLIFDWVEPGEGVQVVDGVPHGLLLLNSQVLNKFRFNVLANDPRDFRGSDLVMARDFKRLGLKLKIHWDVHCFHFEPDGESFKRPEASSVR